MNNDLWPAKSRSQAEQKQHCGLQRQQMEAGQVTKSMQYFKDRQGSTTEPKAIELNPKEDMSSEHRPVRRVR
jgi:hypothetical protein